MKTKSLLDSTKKWEKDKNIYNLDVLLFPTRDEETRRRIAWKASFFPFNFNTRIKVFNKSLDREKLEKV